MLCVCVRLYRTGIEQPVFFCATLRIHVVLPRVSYPGGVPMDSGKIVRGLGYLVQNCMSPSNL